MNFKLIVAVDKNNGIGKNNKIPWYFSEDLKYFAKNTKGSGNNAIIMGRKTYESICIIIDLISFDIERRRVLATICIL